MKPNFYSKKASDIKIEIVDDTAIVTLTGHIDEIAADVLSSQLDETLEDSDPKKVIFDLSEVYYMGSSGLGQIMRAYRQTKKDNLCNVAIVKPQPLIEDLFRLTKLDKLLPIYESVGEAKKVNYSE